VANAPQCDTYLPAVGERLRGSSIQIKNSVVSDRMYFVSAN
jgi:hypothetical protein